MKRVMLEVVDARPPNFDAIVAVLPGAADPGVMFAYGDKVYFPGGRGPLTRELDAHERVHLERQKGDVAGWWARYLAEPKFRFYEELLAHKAEYDTYCRRHINAIKRYQALTSMTTRLMSALYGVAAEANRGGVIEVLGGRASPEIYNPDAKLCIA